MSDTQDFAGEAMKCWTRAVSCRKQAEATSPEHRADFLSMAQSWELLATQYESFAGERAIGQGANAQKTGQPNKP
jgi:hypothetical protein